MPKGELPNFLHEKYADLPGSPPVESAVRKVIRQGKPGPQSKEARVEAYMDRLEDITEDERGFRLLKYKLLGRFTINVQDQETLDKIAGGLYESEKRIAIEQGHGASIARLESQGDINQKYKPLILEKSRTSKSRTPQSERFGAY